MDSMPYTYGFDQSYGSDRQVYYDPSAYPPHAPLFTQQELGGFDPAQCTFDQMTGVEDMDVGLAWEQQEKSMGWPYGDMAGYNMPMDYPHVPDFYGGCFQDGAAAGSCQTSPFQTQFGQQQQPASPVTPAGSPLQCAANSAPSAFLLVPVENNGQYQYSAYQVPMASADSYLGQLAFQSGFESQHASPYTVPSLTASPVSREAPAAEDDDEEEEDEDDEDEDDDEDDDRSVLPNYGNTELRGMGLYDDTPDLMYCATPVNCSPVTPHDQLRPAFGRGLVLERSFGLPAKMLADDEGDLQVGDEESWRPEPVY